MMSLFPKLERSEEDYVVRHFDSASVFFLSDRCAIRRIVDWFRSPITSDVQQPTTAPHPRAAVARPELFRLSPSPHSIGFAREHLQFRDPRVWAASRSTIFESKAAPETRH